MKISVNLATRPFIELRPLFARLRIVMAALGVLAIALGVTLHMLHSKASDAQQKMDALKSRTNQYTNEEIRNEAKMKQPANAAVLQRSQFFNDMFARKSFSWTAVMMDLEDVLPAGVQVTSIEPNITPEGAVTIRMKVAGDRDRAVELVRNLETSKRFLNPRLSDESMQANDQSQQRAAALAPGGVEFDILSGYNPLPSDRKAKSKDEDAKKSTNASDVKPAKPAIAKPASSVNAKPAAASTTKAVASKPVAAKPSAAVKGGAR